MPLDKDGLKEVTDALLWARGQERGRLVQIRNYMRNKTNDIHVPTKANAEYKMLVDQARFNVLPTVVKAKAQNLFVEGYRPTGESGRATSNRNVPVWGQVWQPNRMDARQGGLYRAALTYGYSYAAVLPGKVGNNAERRSVPLIIPYSPLRCTALYEDPANDEWPRYALTVEHPDALTRQRQAVEQDPADLELAALLGASKVRVWDESHLYTFDMGTGLDVADVKEHGLGVCPVVRFLDSHELDGCLGMVEPLLPAQRQLNQTTFSLLMTQQFQAFQQRWATGMAYEEDEEGRPVNPFQAGADTLFQNESPDGRFGTFDQANLAGYLESRDKGLLYVATTAQLPPHNLLVGTGISNLSAEALAALESGHRQDIEEHQHSFGESIEQMVRLCGLALGTDEGRAAWEDTSAQVVWRDTTPRSLSQVADALGKLATQLNIPPRVLWERIPGVTDQDIERWEHEADQEAILDELSELEDGDSLDVVRDLKARADALGVLIRSGVDPDDAARRVDLDGLAFTGAIPVTLRPTETKAQQLED